MEATIFEKHLRDTIVKFKKTVYDDCCSVLCDIHPDFLANTINFENTPFSKATDESKKCVALLVYGTLESYWTLEYTYNKEDLNWVFPHLPFNPTTYPFPVYTIAAISRKDDSYRIVLDRQAMHLCFRNIDGYIAINNQTKLSDLMTSRSFFEFANNVFTLVEQGAASVLIRGSTITSSADLFLPLMNSGDESRTITDMIDSIRLMIHVFIPFFSAQSTLIYKTQLEAEN